MSRTASPASLRTSAHSRLRLAEGRLPGGSLVSELPETRFTKAGDVDIAYQIAGPAGGLDLVFIPGWVSHLEVMWELPEFARFLDRLAAMGRLILFDKRGTGLSDRVAGTPTLEQRAEDIAARARR